MVLNVDVKIQISTVTFVSFFIFLKQNIGYICDLGDEQMVNVPVNSFSAMSERFPGSNQY